LTPPPSRLRRFGRILGRIAFGLALLTGTALVATAMTVQLAGVTRTLALLALAIGAALALGLRVRTRRAGWAGFLLILAAATAWYGTVRPSAERAWAPDVARGVTADIDGAKVTLHDVRNFRWRDEDHATEAWETRTYDLTRLDSIDMLTSVWDNPDIAHLLVSFGFTTGDHVVFSVEIRREQGEAFSNIGGLFRQFEQVLIAADEEDIVKLRTNYRQEDVRLFPVKLDKDKMRALFLGYATLGNDLAREPAFYNTITANCTSTVYRLAQGVTGDLPLDIRLLKTGRLPEYLQELGGLKGDMPMAERRAEAAITARAQAAAPGADFSAEIRVR
jgi:Ca2+/Na+ antiporter